MANETSSTSRMKQVLSEEAKQRLAEITAELDHQSSESSKFKFIKFLDGEHKLLSFIPERTHSVMVTYPNAPDKPVQRFKYYAYDLTENPNSTEEQEWTVSATVARELVRWINKGYFVLSVTRHGTDLKTRYDIEPQID